MPTMIKTLILYALITLLTAMAFAGCESHSERLRKQEQASSLCQQDLQAE